MCQIPITLHHSHYSPPHVINSSCLYVCVCFSSSWFFFASVVLSSCLDFLHFFFLLITSRTSPCFLSLPLLFALLSISFFFASLTFFVCLFVYLFSLLLSSLLLNSTPNLLQLLLPLLPLSQLLLLLLWLPLNTILKLN